MTWAVRIVVRHVEGTPPYTCPTPGTPITGIADYCARAASGHAAAIPSPAMNSRRLLNNLVGGSQQRFRDGEAERLGGFEVDD
jgi:hypothetical protein